MELCGGVRHFGSYTETLRREKIDRDLRAATPLDSILQETHAVRGIKAPAKYKLLCSPANFW
jgi:hypothetical protein